MHNSQVISSRNPVSPVAKINYEIDLHSHVVEVHEVTDRINAKIGDY